MNIEDLKCCGNCTHIEYMTYDEYMCNCDDDNHNTCIDNNDGLALTKRCKSNWEWDQLTANERNNENKT